MAYMSEEGYKQLIEELKYLESVERPKIVSAIAEARDKGDLSENAEYDAAKEAQGLLEMKISQLWLFFRWGTKAIRQEVVSSNPHTKIVYSEYIELKKRKKK